MELEVLKQQLDELASPVGFGLVGAPAALDEVSAPEQTLIWESSFAVLALIPVPSVNIEALTKSEVAAREWMWRRLIQSERIGKLLDGYLICALPARPDSSVRAAIRDVELGTSVCRKHVIWPNETDWKEQLWGVTVLGLPTVQRVVPTTLGTPSLPPIAARALQLYRQTKNYETTAEKLRQIEEQTKED